MNLLIAPSTRELEWLNAVVLIDEEPTPQEENMRTKEENPKNKKERRILNLSKFSLVTCPRF